MEVCLRTYTRLPLAVIFTLFILLANVTTVLSTEHCHISTSESLEIGNVDGQLLGIHIRSNIKTAVEIVDSTLSPDAIRIAVEKSGPSAESLRDIVTDEAMHDVGNGMVYVLQVDYQGATEVTGSVIAGSTIGVLLVCIVVSICAWQGHQWCQKRRERNIRNENASRNHITQDMVVEQQEMTLMTQTVNTGTRTEGPTSISGATPQTSCKTCHIPHISPNSRSENIYIRQPGIRGGAMTPPEWRMRGGGAGGNVRGLSKGTLVTMSLMLCVSLVYANCRMQPEVRIRIYIPTTVTLDHIQVFLNHAQGGEVDRTGWSQQNVTHMSIYELDNVELTAASPCDAATICPDANAQNLVGCDSAKRSCVCERGFYLLGDLCMDIDECVSGLHTCPSTATCQNSIGSYICRCGYGYYGTRGTCQACSVGCPSGLYESEPCTNFKDRSCTECGPCEGAKYEIRSCRGSLDRQCMHVAYPLLVKGNAETRDALEAIQMDSPRLKNKKRLKVETSVNIFAENLHSTRNVRNKYYVTDNTQATDFFLVRESGLQVHIGISHVQLIPEYEDVNHDNDNYYVLKSPDFAENLPRFRKVLRNYCRSPIPDYYIITAEIARDRTTSAEFIKCDSKDT